MNTGPRHILSLRDLSDADIDWIIRRGREIAGGSAARDTLRGRVIGIYFSRTSTRTRTSFSVGALRLGAQIVSYGPSDLQLNTGESIEDTARVLGGMLDGLVIRTAGLPEEMRTFATYCPAVVNAMSADEHPTQALADLTTMSIALNGVEGARVLYVGEGNNTAAALALAVPRFKGAELHLRTPPGYGVDPKLLAEANDLAARHGARVCEQHDLTHLPAEVDIVYTTRWQTTGTSKADPRWRDSFAPFAVDTALLSRYPGTRFMHDLPAHRGEEVSGDVLDGPASIAFQQAQHKLHSAMAVLEWCLGS